MKNFPRDKNVVFSRLLFFLSKDEFLRLYFILMTFIIIIIITFKKEDFFKIKINFIKNIKKKQLKTKTFN